MYADNSDNLAYRVKQKHICKYLAGGVMEPRYPNRKSPSKLDDYELTFTSWLFREFRRHRKQRYSIK